MERGSIALLLCCAVATIGCGGSEPDPVTTPAPTTTPEAGAQVEMVDFEFVPAEVTVPRGEKITWMNRDATEHNAVAREGDAGPDSDLLGQGESYEWTADVEPGPIAYICTIHPGMEGTITVAAGPDS